MIPLIIAIAAFIVLGTIGVSVVLINTYKTKHDDIKSVYNSNLEYQTKLEESYDKLGNKHSILLEDYTSLSKKYEESDIYSINLKEQLDIATNTIENCIKVNNNLKDDVSTMELLTGISLVAVKKDIANHKDQQKNDQKVKSKQLDDVLVEVNRDIKKRNKNTIKIITGNK